MNNDERRAHCITERVHTKTRTHPLTPNITRWFPRRTLSRFIVLPVCLLLHSSQSINMPTSTEISKTSRWILYLILSIMGLYIAAVEVWQIQVIRGNRMENPDGSADDWHEQKTHYGIAFADLVVGIPVSVAAAFCAWSKKALAHFLFSLMAFWLVYCNIFTTSTSLRFYNPKIFDLDWFVTFPFGTLLGLSYLTWVVVHFEAVFGNDPGGTSYSPIPDMVNLGEPKSKK